MAVDDLKVKIGLEVHCQLTSLKTKLFCSCSADYRGDKPNTHVCPVCIGIPGTLPVVNEKAVNFAVMVASALNSKISERMVFFRKNYFYPDMPKNFQISQYDKAGGIPISVGGFLTLDGGRRVMIRRIQLEEDPGKLSYEGTIETSRYTLVDYNRAGVALVEVVTEPDLESPREARIFLEKLRSQLEHLGVFDGSLEGSMRCDANISLAEGRRVEVKNISSFKEVERALNFEVTRQGTLVGKGIRVGMETRHWDEVRRITVTLRVKEEEQDYRYFPEPDLMPIQITEEYVSKLRASMPELPESRRQRFIETYGISGQNADVLIDNKALADFFEKCVELKTNPQEASNWIVGDLIAYLHAAGIELSESKITPKHLTRILQMIDDGTISIKIAKLVLEEMMKTGATPEEIVERKGLRRISDTTYLADLVNKIFRENTQAVSDAVRDEKAVNYLVGQLMKATQGKADPELANKLIRDKLAELSK